jgi:multidrug transporter EmrE-like cation transporter
MDKVAIASSSKTVYYAWGRLIMAGTALAGSAAASGGARSFSRRQVLLQPSVIILILLTCGADALYQLSQYQAMAKISPVYVTAVKRGGGILLSSIVGAVFFSESLQGRLAPILAIVVGVVFLCL